MPQKEPLKLTYGPRNKPALKQLFAQSLQSKLLKILKNREF